VAALIGDDERASGRVTIKHLRADAGVASQEQVSMGDAAAVIQQKIRSGSQHA
jgi:histidyl-tRNA synthetase